MSAERADVIAIFGPTAVGKTGVAVALAELLRERGEDPVAVSCDAIQVYRGLEILSGAPTAEERSQLEHRLVGVIDPAEEFSAGRFAELARGEIDGLLAAGRTPIVVGGTGLYMRAALADLDLRPPVPPEVRELVEAQVRELGPEAMHAELDADVAQRVHPNDRKRVARALELQRAGLDPPERSGELWTARLRHPTALVGIVVSREELADRIDARVDAMLAAGAKEEAIALERMDASRTARAALGFEEAIRDDRPGDEGRSSPLRPPADDLACARWRVSKPSNATGSATPRWPFVFRRPAGGDNPPMRFEKWQALGNDYIVLEQDSLPFALSAERAHAICDPHFGCHADGILLLSRPSDPDAHVAELRIFNPDGSEAELSGNGAREAILYLRRSGWTDRDEFTILTAAGEITPEILGDHKARVAMAPARTISADFPSGPEDGRGTIDVAGSRARVPARLRREPAMRDRDRRRPRGARPAGDRAGHRVVAAVSESHQRELLERRGLDRPGADLRARGGGDALVGNRGDRRRRCRLPPRRDQPDPRGPRRRGAARRDRCRISRSGSRGPRSPCSAASSPRS